MTQTDPSHYLQEIHVAEDVYQLPYTQEILKRAGLPATIIPTGHTPQGFGAPYSRSLNKGKRHLFLSKNKGSFFKPCPGTSEYTCCGYHVLNTGMNCPIDCVYCILQAYLNHPWITAFVNVEELFEELKIALEAEPDRLFRIGTGEFTDSLALERITGVGKMLVDWMGRRENGLLELKTKSGWIDSLQHADHCGKTILSWSLNSPSIMQRQEIRAASLEQRLQAARQAAEWGYHLSFHFDPLVYHTNWREEYGKTVDRLFKVVPKDSIVWISLGGLRYLPALKDIATHRFPQSRLFHEEFIDGLDGKLRYFRSRRKEMYAFLLACLQRYSSPDTCIYFCMESEEMWYDVFGYSTREKGGLEKMLDEAARCAMKKYPGKRS